MKNKKYSSTLPSSLNQSHARLSVAAQFKWLLAASLSLALLSCQSPTGLNVDLNRLSTAPQAPHTQAEPSLSRFRKASAISARAQLSAQKDGQYDQVQLQIRLPKFLHAQMASDEIAFIRVSVQGQAISQINGSLVAVTSDTLTATLNNIPRSGGKLRVVTVQAYDASQTLLPAFSAKGYYTSSSDTTVALSVNRQYYLLGAILEKLFVDRSDVASLIDLTSLQSTLEDMFDFNADNHSFGTDPLMYDLGLLTDQIANDGSFADATSLSAAALGSVANPVVMLKTADDFPIGEELFLVVNDPRSLPLKISRLTDSGQNHTIPNVTPGTWTLNVQDTAGTILASTSLIAENDGTATLTHSELTLSGIQTARGEFQVNTYISGSQENAELAIDDDGDFVIVWSSSAQDPDASPGIYAQRYNSSGLAQGIEFKVNTYASYAQTKPAIAMDDDGDFVITWQSYLQDGSAYGVYAQRYNSVGVAQGSEFQVNTYTTTHQMDPTIAMDDDGDFVIAWKSNIQDGSSYGVYAQRYNSVGLAQGSEFQVNTYISSRQFDPKIAMDSEGGFVITWVSRGQDGNLDGIYAQRYNSVAVAQGSEFQVNTTTSNNQDNPAVAMDDEGDFLISWSSTGQDGDDKGIYAQRYTSAGVPQGDEFQVNTYTTHYQDGSCLAIDSHGNFIVTWLSNNQDGSNNGVYAQRYHDSGLKIGAEFQINTYTTDHQSNRSLAVDAAGRFISVWTSENGQDGSSNGIFAQRYNDQGQSL